MFRLVEAREYWWPVTVLIPDDGGASRGEFRVRLRVLSVESLKRDVPLRDLVHEAFVGFDGVGDADGRAMEDTAESRARLLADPHVMRGIVAAFSASLAPQQDRSGNSSAPPGTG